MCVAFRVVVCFVVNVCACLLVCLFACVVWLFERPCVCECVRLCV